MTISEILNLCQYDVSHRKRYDDDLEPCSRFRWEKIVSYANSSYGMDCTLEDFKSQIKSFGEKGQFWVSDIKYDLTNFVKAYQISLIVEACLIRHTDILKEEDVNWDKLLSKINNIYGVSVPKWQLFHPGVNNTKPEDILKRISDKIFWSGNDNRVIFTASEFKRLMLK